MAKPLDIPGIHEESTTTTNLDEDLGNILQQMTNELPSSNGTSLNYMGYEDMTNEQSLQKLHVHAGPGNTILTLTDHAGRVLVNTSGGLAGFKKAQRGQPEAAYQATQLLLKKCQEKNLVINNLEILLNGFGSGREVVFRAVKALTDWKISRITDATPIAFNGCRPKKARRL